MTGASFTDLFFVVINVTSWYVLIVFVWFMIKRHVPKLGEHIPDLSKADVTLGWVIFVAATLTFSSSLHPKREYQEDIHSSVLRNQNIQQERLDYQQRFNRPIIDKSRQPSETASEERAENTREMLDWRETSE